jgi:ABC-2 type transport system ATP-binding protein
VVVAPLPTPTIVLLVVPGSPALVRVSNLRKQYGQFTALEDVTLSIRAGEVLGLIGPNGSGKTTLFECLGGVLPYDAGRIEWRLDGSAQRLMFYLPDGVTPWPDQTVGWILDFVLGYFEADPTQERPLIERLGLEPLLRKRIDTLSKGQRKRVLLAAGLLTPSRVLLADEPFDGLDLRQTREVAALLRDVAGSGRTLFLSIHQIADAARVCDRFVLLNAGRVCGEGTLDELARRAPLRVAGRSLNLEEVFLALT